MASPSQGATSLVEARSDLGVADVLACQEILKQGSKSFAAASLLLPARIRPAAAAVYAFCRVADDAVDLGDDLVGAVEKLRRRLDRIYAGAPDDDPVDRGFAVVVDRFRIPKSVPLALIEGFEWDAEGRRYETIEELEAYCARVASTVGVMMTLLMDRDSPEVMARACDLGLAMQLTNIARDVGEDARAGRIYLPTAWLREAGIDPEQLLVAPAFSPALGSVIARLLKAAERYYHRADLGITMLPRDCRVAIRAARLIYADIGRIIVRNGHDSVTQRAFTSKPRKLWLLLRSFAATLWPRRECADPPQEASRFLVEAVERPTLTAGARS